MTPLHQAAQALLDAINPQGWHKAEMLRKALADEQAQAVEPVAWMKTWNHGGGKLSHSLYSEKPSAPPFPDLAWVTPLYAHPAPPPPAGEQIDWQGMHLSEILAEKGITLQKTFVEKPRDHVGDATTMVGRIEFIQKLRDRIAYLHEIGVNDTPVLLEKAADMLEADGPLTNEDTKAYQVAVPPGFALVPIEPTQEMIAAGGRVNSEWLNGHEIIDKKRSDWLTQGVYKAMLAAAPQPTQGDKP